jgi:hypothetical protein
MLKGSVSNVIIGLTTAFTNPIKTAATIAAGKLATVIPGTR